MQGIPSPRSLDELRPPHHGSLKIRAPKTLKKETDQASKDRLERLERE